MRERWRGGLIVLSMVTAGCADVPNRPTCRVTPLQVGVCSLGADHVLGSDHSAEERLVFALYAFLVEGPGGELALVDLGPMSLGYANDMFRRYGFFRDLGPDVDGADRYPDDIRQPYGNVFRQLDARGIAAADVDHIIFTHLHADHHGLDDATNGGAAERFENAILHVSRQGWTDNLSRRKDGQWTSYVDYAFSDFLHGRDRLGTVRFEDDEEVFPGLRTMYLGGHSVCSQAVAIDTDHGMMILTSDDVYRYDLLEENVLPRIYTTRARYEEAVRKVVTLAERSGGTIVPLHDPAVWAAYERSPDAWLRELRQLSDKAILGYRQRQPKRPRADGRP